MQSTPLKNALADLRFLGTAAAARVMAQHVRDDEPGLMFECALGLAGLRETVRPAALAEMHRLLDDPDFPVSSWFLNTMSVLAVSSADPVTQLGERSKLFDADWALAVQALPAKTGKARAATAQALSSEQPAQTTAQQKAELGEILGASLIDLPPEKQAAELEYHWDVLRSTSLLPTLKLIATLPLKNPGSNEMTSYTTREVKSAALERWFELDPVGAREEALSQVGTSTPSLTADSLAFFGNEKLPQFESLWAAALMTEQDYQRETVFAALLARFGTGSAVAQVLEKTTSKVGEWACVPQGAALGYLVKFDPASARSLVERAVKERGKGKTACDRSVFQDIAPYATDPMLTEVALTTLDDPDQQVTMDALIYLMAYGDKSVEQPVWNRYVEWSEKWKNRADTLESREAGSSGDWEEMGLGENLARTLLANQGWLATPDSITRVLERCVGEQMCAQLKQIADEAKRGTGPYNITASRSARNESYQVAQYNPRSLDLLDAKIAQFPRGTRFTLIPTSPQNQDQMKLEGDVKAILEKNGMRLVEAP